MGRPSADLDDYLDWQDPLESFRASGLSVDEFCLQEGVSRSTYYRWVSQLKNGIPEVLQAEKETRQQAESGQTAFVPITLKRSRACQYGVSRPLPVLSRPSNSSRDRWYVANTRRLAIGTMALLAQMMTPRIGKARTGRSRHSRLRNRRRPPVSGYAQPTTWHDRGGN